MPETEMITLVFEELQSWFRPVFKTVLLVPHSETIVRAWAAIPTPRVSFQPSPHLQIITPNLLAYGNIINQHENPFSLPVLHAGTGGNV